MAGHHLCVRTPSSGSEAADHAADDEYRRQHEQELHGLIEVLDEHRLLPAQVQRAGHPDVQRVPHAGARPPRTSRAIAYVRHFYGLDPEDLALYHLTIDSTRTPLEACVEPSPRPPNGAEEGADRLQDDSPHVELRPRLQG